MTIRVVAGLLRLPEPGAKRYLVGTRANTGKYDGCFELPGGKVEPGETDEQALQREWREELLCQIDVGKRAAEWTNASTTPAYHITVYAVTLAAKGDLDNWPVVGDSHSDLRWVSFGWMLTLTEAEGTPSMRPLAEQLVRWERQ